ncbi:MAG: nuclear transport factor 2 family protein [Actinobacteria bacterium]|nr:nuclear transport factor 2 family protein [Actinomycetota bacterium]
MVTAQHVQDWLDSYTEAWRTYDPESIGDLFATDAAYAYNPWDEPILGRQAIVASWLADQDRPGSWDAEYHPALIDGDEAAARGRTRYASGAAYENLFLLEFGADGRCSRFVEWYMERPAAGA